MTARNTTIDTRGKPRIWNLLGERALRDFLLQVAAGQIPGIASYHVFGFDTDLGNQIKLIYPGSSMFIYPSEAQAVSVVSSNSDDTNNGLGARVLRLIGLAYDGSVQTEDMWLKGTTPVISIGDYRRVFSAFVLSSGSLNGAAGTITLTYRDTTFIGEISTQFNVLMNGNFTVPKNTNAYVYQYGFSMGAPKEVFLGMRITSPDQENSNWVVLDFRYKYGGEVNETLSIPYMITENTDIELFGYTQADSNTYISAYMDLLLVDKEYDWENPIRADERGGLEKVE